LCVPTRSLHVVPQVDFAWPHGWMACKTPDRADLLETVETDIGGFIRVGQTYYDERYLPERFHNNLLVAIWGQSSISWPLYASGESAAAAVITKFCGEVMESRKTPSRAPAAGCRCPNPVATCGWPQQVQNRAWGTNDRLRSRCLKTF